MIDLRIYKKWKVFICHATDDKKLFVNSLVENLQKRGTFLWYDKISIPEGEPIHDAIHKGLKGAKGGIVIFSPDFIKDYSHEKREWVKEEYHVLVYKKNTEGCFLIPVFYNIEYEKLPETFKGPLDNIKGFTFNSNNKDDNTVDLSEKIHNLVKGIQLKHKKKKLLLFFGVLIAAFVITFFIYKFLYINNKEDNIKIQIQESNQHNKLKDSIKIVQDNHIIGKITDTATPHHIKINKKSILEHIKNKVDVYVIIINENNNIETDVSNRIANACDEKWEKTSTGLFRSNFIKTSDFQELLEGNPEIIDNLELSKYTNLLILGKISFDSTRKGSLVNNTFISKVNLTAKIISIKDGTIKPIQTYGEWNDVSEYLALNGAINNLIQNFKEELSLIK